MLKITYSLNKCSRNFCDVFHLKFPKIFSEILPKILANSVNLSCLMLLFVTYSLFQGTNVERDKQGRPLGFSGRSVNSGSSNRNQWGDSNSSSSNKWGNTYGLSPQFLESLNIHGALISKVFVANVSS